MQSRGSVELGIRSRSGESDTAKVRSETPKRSVRSSGSLRQEWDFGAWSQDTEQWTRWPDESAFLVAVWDFRIVLALAIANRHRMLKNTRLHLLNFAVLNPSLSVSSFHPLFFFFFCFFFLQSVKRPHGRVVELTTGSTPLDERPGQQNPPFGYDFLLDVLSSTPLEPNVFCVKIYPDTWGVGKGSRWMRDQENMVNEGSGDYGGCGENLKFKICEY